MGGLQTAVLRVVFLYIIIVSNLLGDNIGGVLFPRNSIGVYVLGTACGE